MNIYNIQRLVITGTERFSSELLYSRKQNLMILVKMLNILLEYYKATYKMINFQKSFTTDLDGFTIIVQN